MRLENLSYAQIGEMRRRVFRKKLFCPETMEFRLYRIYDRLRMANETKLMREI